MIDIPALVAKLQLDALTTRIDEREQARAWAFGKSHWGTEALMPKPKDDAGRAAMERLHQQMQSIGPEVLQTKLNAAIGIITWGGNDQSNLDERLEALDLGTLAERLGTDLIVNGIASAIAATPDNGKPAQITRLGGYVEPITDPDDTDRITGLYQTWATVTKMRLEHHVRIYDFEDQELREWRSLSAPLALARPPTSVTPDAPMPRYQIALTDGDGLVIGEMLSAMPLFKGLYATEFRANRVEEIAAFPRLFTKGTVKVDDAGPAVVLRGDKDSDARFLEPGSLEQLRNQHRDKLERVRRFCALPGGFLGNDSPSGEALREANVRFYRWAQRMANRLSMLLTQLVADFCALEGIPNPPPVVLLVDQELEKQMRTDLIITAFDKNLIPLRVAVRELQPFFPTFSDAELEAFVNQNQGSITPDALRRALGGEST